MSTPVNSDIFLVSRGGSSYHVNFETIMSTLENSDLLLVNRGGASFKITGEDFKNSITPTDPLSLTVSLSSTNPSMGTPLSCIASANGGTPPYGYSYQWKSKNPGGTISVIAGATNVVYVPQASDVGNELACQATVDDDAGGSETATSAFSAVVSDPDVGIAKASTRFNPDDSAYLNRTFAQGNQKTWTFSCWVKRSNLGVTQKIFGNQDISALDGVAIQFNSDDTLQVYDVTSSLQWSKNTSRVFGDTSAWYAICISVDTTQSIGDNRLKLYINGTQETSFITNTNPVQNSNTQLNSATTHGIGRSGEFNSSYMNGYLSDIYFIDSQALDPTAFAETNVNGTWVPKAYTGVYSGVNSFHLAMDPSVAGNPIGTDSSGLGNDWTTNNLSSQGTDTDLLRDSPSDFDDGIYGTGNYATLNPLVSGSSTLSNGNLVASGGSNLPTIIPGSGQWYYEIDGTGFNWDGVEENFLTQAGAHNFGQYTFANQKPAGYSTLCTFNLPDPVVPDSEDGMQPVIYTGNGTSKPITSLAFESGLTWIKNRDDTANHGLYDQVRGPTKVLVSNEPDAQDTLPNGLTGWTPNGFIVGSDSTVNTLDDKYVAWNWYAGDQTVTVPVGAYGSNVPSLQSEVRANPETGFSVVKFTTGPGGFDSIAHNLNHDPQLIITKDIESSSTWTVYLEELGQSNYLALNETYGSQSSANIWGQAGQMSTTTFGFKSGGNAASNHEVVAYCFSEVAAYSRIGEYDANTSNYPFINCGFEPAFVLIKAYAGTSGNNWVMYDNKRNPYNLTDERLVANQSAAEYASTATALKFFSNGFMPNGTDSDTNGSGRTYLFAAFASAPFKYANAH